MTITKEKISSVVAYMYNNAEQCLTFFYENWSTTI